MIDFSAINYGQPDNVWEEMKRLDAVHLESHPICEICKNKPSVRITPVGTLRASCIECIDKIREEIQQCINEDLSKCD